MNRAERRRQKKTAGPAGGPSAAVLQRAFEGAVGHHQSGRLSAAVSAYQDILKIAPGHPDALHLLGVARHQMGDSSAAEKDIRQAVRADKSNPAFHRSLGKVLQARRQYDEAIRCYRAAVQLDPKSIDALNDMGTAYLELSRMDEAVDCFQRVLKIDGRNISANNNLGLVLREWGDIEGAVASFRQAVESDPNSIEAHNNLGLLLQERGETEAALVEFRTAVRLQPVRAASWIHFAEALRFARIESADPSLEKDILACFAQERVNTQRLAVSAIALLRLDDVFARVLRTAADDESDTQIVLNEEALRALNHPLLIALLWHTVIPDVDFERLLTWLRRELLDAALRDALPDGCDSLLFALAANCFTNEYVFAVMDDEEDGVQQLLARLDTDYRAVDEKQWRLVALAGCYRPLHTLAWSDDLGEHGESTAPEAFHDLIRRQVLEPHEEAALKDKIESLTPVSDSVSQKVRTQYEENPYPRWQTVNAGRARPLTSVVRQLFPHLHDLPRGGGHRTDILIAGCGTGQTAIQASYRFTEPHILAVDLSRASMAYGWRRAKEFGIQSIEFMHGDILELGKLGRDFDFIEAAGVLHHMADPLAGWQVLRDMLRPGGFMKIALYSELARQHVTAAREFAAAGAYEAGPEGMRRCRQDIIALPDDAAARGVVESLDFHAMSPFRDLVLHVQERCYALPEIAEMLEELKLQLTGFELRDRTRYALYRERFPDDGTLTDLTNWHQLETSHPNTFAGMYQFWVRAAD